MAKGKKKPSAGKIVGDIAVLGLAIAVAAATSDHHHHRDESAADRRKREERERQQRLEREARERQQRVDREERARLQRLERAESEKRQREEQKELERQEQIRLEEAAQTHLRVLRAYPNISEETFKSLSVLTPSQSYAPSHIEGKTLPHIVLEHGQVDAFIYLINTTHYKVNLEQPPYLNPLAQLILRADAVSILKKIRLAVSDAKALFELIKPKFDRQGVFPFLLSGPSIDPILTWMINNQSLPQEGIVFLNQKATAETVKKHFDVYDAFFAKNDFVSQSKAVRVSYLTQCHNKNGELQLQQLKTLYNKNKKELDVGLLYDDLLSVPVQTSKKVLTIIRELHRANLYPRMTFTDSFWQQLILSDIANAKKFIDITMCKEKNRTSSYLSSHKFERIITIANEVITDKHVCADLLTPLVIFSEINDTATAILVDIANSTHNMRFSAQLLMIVPQFQDLSSLRRALLPEILASEPDHKWVLQRWYVKNKTYHVKEMYQDLQAADRVGWFLPIMKYCIKDKTCSLEIDSELFPMIDGNYDIIGDLAGLDNKVAIRTYVNCIPAANIEYKIALFHQFPQAFQANDYYLLFRNYFNEDQMYSQYQYIESLLYNPSALLETLGPITQYNATVDQPAPSAPPAPVTLATAVALADSTPDFVAVYAVAVPYSEAFETAQDLALQKENNPTKMPAEEQDSGDHLSFENRGRNRSAQPPQSKMSAEGLKEKSLIAQKILLAFAKISMEKISCAEKIISLTRQLKNEWLTYHFVPSYIDIMYRWAQVSVLFLEVHQTTGHAKQPISQFMKEDTALPEKGFSGAWKSTSSMFMSTIGLSNNKYSRFYMDICSASNKTDGDISDKEKLIKEHTDVAAQFEMALQI